MSDEIDIDDQDLIDLGKKIVEMADRARVMNMAAPGASARWHFEMDDVRYRVQLSVVSPSNSEKCDI